MSPRSQLVAMTLVSALAVSACVPVVLFGGAAAGAYVASERRTISQQAEDKQLDIMIERRIEENFGKKIHVNATVFNGVVLLTGEIPSPELRKPFDELMRLTPGVKRLINETKQIPIAPTQWQLNDAAMTTKVKSRLSTSPEFHVSHIKVITEGNDVYLMGKVSQKEADAAIEIVRTTSGVNRVVNVFEIMSDDEWRKEQSAGAAGTANAPASQQK